jgi:hypothetical protein
MEMAELSCKDMETGTCEGAVIGELSPCRRLGSKARNVGHYYPKNDLQCQTKNILTLFAFKWILLKVLK